VTLEEQMICGALQTLNEEACEDVMEETEQGEAPCKVTSLAPSSDLGESPVTVSLRTISGDKDDNGLVDIKRM
jgi:ankyrin repeat-rich membrane spanning protein